MKNIVPREGANAPHTRSFPRLYWFFYLLVLLTAPITNSIAEVHNSAPQGSLSNVTLTVAGGAKTVNLSSSFSDPDNDDLTYSASSSNTSYVTVGVSSSTLTVTPVAKGSSTVTVTANDGTLSTHVTFTATVNNSPPAGSISDVTLTVGGGAKTVNLSSSISDADGDTITFSATSLITRYVSTSVSGSTLTLTPKSVGSSSIIVTVSDGTASTYVTFTAKVDPKPVNRAPTGSLSDMVLYVASGVKTVDLSSSFSDPDGDTLSFTASSSNTSYVTVSVSGSTLTITPVVKGGNSTITVEANDNRGGTVTASFKATVDNSAPRGTLSDVYLTMAGGAKTVNLANRFSDADGDTLRFSATSSRTNRVTGSVSGSTLTITPVSRGLSEITVWAYDQNSGSKADFAAIVKNSAPQGSLSDVTLTVAGGAQTVDLSSSFSDADGDTLSFTASSSNTSYVTVGVSSSTLTLTPVAKGNSTITVTANDGTASTNVTFTAEVDPDPEPVNRAPTGTLSDMTLTVAGGAQTVNLSSSFSDADGDDLTYSASSSNTSYVTVGVSSSTLTLTPVAKGSSTITVTANDGAESTNVTFTATVEADPESPNNPRNPPPITPNRAPQAVGTIDPITLSAQATKQVTVQFRDPDGDILRYSVAGGNSAASAGMSGNSLTIVGLEAGEATLTVTATDPHGATATQSVDVTVVRPQQPIDEPTPQQPPDNSNRAPQSVGTIAPITLFVQATAQVTVEFTDPDGDTLSYNVSGNNNAVSAGMSGSSVTIVGNAEGTATLTVTATDPHGATASQTIDVTVVQPSEARPSTSRRLLKVSGDNQFAQIHTALPNPLVVEVRDEQERVVEGVTVQFDLAESGLALDSTPTTDANGQASATIRFGDTPGEFAVEVSVAGIDEPVVFTATATATASSLDVVYIDALEVAPNPDNLAMNRVYGVAFSPDGKTLASAHGDTTVRMWDVETRELKRTLGGSLTATSLERRGHKYAVRSVVFSPDGNILASGGRGGRVLLWDADTGRLKQFVLRHAGAVWSLAFSPDGNTLAAATEGGYVYIYDVSNPKRVERKHRLRAHSVRAWSVAFSPDGRFLASGGGDTIVRLWDYETGSIEKLLKGHEEQVLSIEFGADNTLASASADGTVRMWDVETKDFRILEGHTDWVFSVAFHPNGDILGSTGKDMSVRLWDTASGVPLNVRWNAIRNGGVMSLSVETEFLQARVTTI